MKRDPEMLQKIVDGIQQYGTIKNAAAAAGASYSSTFTWLKASASATAGDEEFMVSVGGERLMFHDAVKMATRQVDFEIAENFRYRMLHGTNEVARFQGKTVYRRDPALDHLSDQDLEDLGITSRYLRDASGEFIPELIHHEPSTQATALYLQAAFPKQYGNKQTIEVNSRSAGVQVVRHQHVPKPLPAPVQEVARVAAIEVPIDVEPDDLTDILGEQSPAIAEPPLAPPAEPKPAAVEPPKVLSELERDLLARLAGRAGKAERAGPVVVPVGRPERDDDDPRRVGSDFVPPPNAVKMV